MKFEVVLGMACLTVREVEEADADRDHLRSKLDVLRGSPGAKDRGTVASVERQAGSGASAIISAPSLPRASEDLKTLQANRA